MSVNKDNFTLRMDFQDNRVLALLIGEHNQNLAHLEQRLDVSLNSFGNSIKIKGNSDAVKRTRSVLEDMYQTINETVGPRMVSIPQWPMVAVSHLILGRERSLPRLGARKRILICCR